MSRFFLFRFIVFPFLVLSPLHSQANNLCPILMGGVPVEYEAIVSLHKALQDDYTVEILKKNIDGTDRLVILMGETHFKTELSYKIGKEVLEQFPDRGLEGFNPQLTWAGKLDEKIWKPLKKRLGLKEGKEFGFTRFVMNKLLDRNSGSTIQAAATEETKIKLDTFMRQILEKMSSTELSEEIVRLKQMSNQELDTAILRFKGGETIYSNRDQLRMAEVVAQSSDQSVAPTSPAQTVRNFRLEGGRTASLAENINSMSATISFGLVLTSLLTQLLPHEGVISMVQEFFKYLPYSYAGYNFSAFLLDRNNYPSWYKKIFPMQVAQWNSRNAIMATNINKVFTETPDMNQMLSIVGKAHISPLKELLINQGYESIPLPSESDFVMGSFLINEALPQ